MEINDMKVIVLDNDNVKIKEIENVKVIRINDNNYNLLVMKDYWPFLGEINGNISIEADEIYNFLNIKGFYTLSHNVFHLIVLKKEDNDDK